MFYKLFDNMLFTFFYKKRYLFDLSQIFIEIKNFVPDRVFFTVRRAVHNRTPVKFVPLWVSTNAYFAVVCISAW